jgi:hypothetical protein
MKQSYFPQWIGSIVDEPKRAVSQNQSLTVKLVAALYQTTHFTLPISQFFAWDALLYTTIGMASPLLSLLPKLI